MRLKWANLGSKSDNSLDKPDLNNKLKDVTSNKNVSNKLSKTN